MLKKNFYFILGGSIVLLASLGAFIAMTIDRIHKTHPIYFSGSFFIVIAIIILAIWISVFLHEIAHAIGYMLKKYKIRMINVFPFVVIKEKQRINIKFAFNLILGIGGIVIPELPNINDIKQIDNIKRTIRFSLIIGPICSLMYGLLSILLLFQLDSTPITIQKYGFPFLFTNVLVSTYITITSLFCLGGVAGDYAGFMLFKKNRLFAINQIYNDYLLQNSDIKSYFRNKKIIFNEMIDVCKDEKYDNLSYTMFDFLFYEWIINNENDKNDFLNDYIDNLIKKDFSFFSNKLKFESFSRLFCHIIIYMCLYYDYNIAKKYWEKNKKDISKSSVAKYYYNQCESIFYSKEIDCKKVISSLDSILKNMSNYFEDEEKMNKIILDFSNSK